MFRSMAARLRPAAVAGLRTRGGGPALWAAAATGQGIAASTLAAGVAIAAVRCEDDADMRRSAAHRVQTKDLAEVRRVVRAISIGTANDSEDWISRVRSAFTTAAREDGTLGQEELGTALQELSHINDQALLWELGPLLFRLLDVQRQGSVTLKDFLMGQAILFAVAKSGAADPLGENCWRALDLHNTGAVTKQELSVTVHLMVHLGAVDPEDLRKIKAMAAAKDILKDKKGKGRHTNVQEQAVEYYMSMYDPDQTGHITRVAFGKFGSLQENFRRLLKNEQVMPMFLPAHADTLE